MKLTKYSPVQLGAQRRLGDTPGGVQAGRTLTPRETLRREQRAADGTKALQDLLIGKLPR